jgi:hypothetical protein
MLIEDGLGDDSEDEGVAFSQDSRRVPRWAGLEYIDDCSALMDYFFRQQDNVRSRGDYHCLDNSIEALDESSSEAYDNDHLWQPLARLMERLPGLVDVVYTHRSQIPPCLLQALHTHLPACRLHHYTFYLRSLNDKGTVPDPHELSLVTSPCLHSLHLRYSDTNGTDDGGRPSYQASAVHAMIEGLAPNLKEVHIYRDTTEESKISIRPRLAPKAWRRATTEKDGFIPSPADLHALELHGHINGISLALNDLHVGRDYLSDWKTRVHFSALRVLKLRHPVNRQGLELLAMESSFPHLTTLLLACGEVWTWQPRDYYDAAKQFIRSLPSLSDLEILEWDNSTSLAPALGHHIRKLILRSCFGTNLTPHRLKTAANFSQQEIMQLATNCPELENLSLQIRRSRGDAYEVATYRALGHFPRLRHLTLTLDASPPPWVGIPGAPASEIPAVYTKVEDHFDESDAEKLAAGPFPYRKGHIKDVFVNTAVDEKLARAIFEVVSSAKASNSSLPLETMIIRVRGGADFCRMPMGPPPGTGLRPFLTNLGREWFLERGLRNDQPDQVCATELGKKAREESDWAPSFGNQRRRYAYTEIFRRIWPEKQPGSNWRDDWESWPLQTA